MSELQLYKFIRDNNIEYHKEEDGLYIYIDFNSLEEFAQLIGTFLTDSIFDICLKESYVAFKIDDILEFYDIDFNNIF